MGGWRGGRQSTSESLGDWLPRHCCVLECGWVGCVCWCGRQRNSRKYRHTTYYVVFMSYSHRSLTFARLRRHCRHSLDTPTPQLHCLFLRMATSFSLHLSLVKPSSTTFVHSRPRPLAYTACSWVRPQVLRTPCCVELGAEMMEAKGSESEVLTERCVSGT